MQLTYVLGAAVLAIVYTLVAKLGLMMDAVAGFASLVWPPTGISLVALVLGGRRLWPGVALGALLVNLWAGAPFWVAAAIAAGNTLEAVLGATAVGRIPGFRPSLDRLADVLGLIVLAALLSTLLSSTVGVASLVLGGIVTPARAFEAFRAWWLGDLIGDVLVAPLLLTWRASRRLDLRPRRLFEGVLLGVSLLSLSLLIFGSRAAAWSTLSGQVYLIFPPLLWAALRFGQRGGVTATFVVSTIAVWGTAYHRGPFAVGAAGTLSGRLLFLQTFLSVVAMTVMILGAVTAERTGAVRSRDDFLAIVSHDLRNMLNAIKLSAAGLSRKLAGGEGHRQLGLIQRSVERMDLLIGDLRDVAAIEAGRLSIERRACGAGDLVREAAEVARPLAAAKEQRLVLLGPAPDFQLMANRERVLQVFANLLGNAVKFTPEGGSITIGAERDGGRGRFTVTDTGPGIERDHLRHIFERYWQAPATAREGSGLGLSIARGIVEAHGGSIWVESHVGSGTRFFVTLPLASAGRPAAE